MKTYRLKKSTVQQLSDTLTPVGIYLQVRDKYPNSLLLESSDYHGSENSRSFICCDPIASFKVSGDVLEKQYPDGVFERSSNAEMLEELKSFVAQFKIQGDANEAVGLFGYHSYDAVQHFENIKLNNGATPIPEMYYALYRYVVAINHFNDTLEITYVSDNEKNDLSAFQSIITNPSFPKYTFQLSGGESCNSTDEEYLNIVEKGIEHSKLGDVFQIVLSRQFKQRFQGDEFNVYRALRAVNPSPYLFYFDYGNYRLMGSSPEAQIVVQNNEASIHPIAGTFRRTGDDAADTELARRLGEDEKENSEHVMLVDLARNDLSKISSEVNVEVYKEVQFYSHVIHLVSKVTGKVDQKKQSIDLMAGTFPAGTLSGAPKYKAMQLIDEYEKTPRGFYGGSIGFIGLNGEINQAIMIRSLMSKDNTLTYQAGAGVVAKSKAINELKEVDNKLAAIKKALKMAEEI